MNNKYKRKYKVEKIIEQLIQLENSGKTKIDLYDLLELVGYDPIDVYFFYVNYIRGRFRFNKDYEDRR